MKNMCAISWVLMIIGAINWGLYGLFDMDLVAMTLGGMPILAKTIYILIGISGLWGLYGMVTKKGCAK